MLRRHREEERVLVDRWNAVVGQRDEETRLTPERLKQWQAEAAESDG